MSIGPKSKNAPETSHEQQPVTAATKPSRPNSFTNFSKPLAKDHPDDPAAPSPKLVGAEELQARIKAARRTRTASQPLPEAVRRKLSHLSDPMHPALRPRSGLTPTPNLNRAPSHKCKSGQDLSIDAVIRRLQAEPDGKNNRGTSHQSGPGEHLQLPGGIPPVPPVPVLPPAATHRPGPYQTNSRRSSVSKRRSPLSIVSSPDDLAEASSYTSRRTSASSRTSKTDEYKEEDENDEVIRVITHRASKARLIKRKHESEPQVPPRVSRSKSQRASGGRSWQGLSRRSILCSV
ncbi:hypothetical protein BDW02DRAFT_574139 [Decorospora gaudefroyi]|uniref:Uncharacterized protein n=1 Tax=Decorospora gaudefroyi TaxID=184978 RepID=A0A6A5K494_9PLEO|nr:hypothetical protein BDW02DRAFT_574139 [Decorospora gaudefroyi]